MGGGFFFEGVSVGTACEGVGTGAVCDCVNVGAVCEDVGASLFIVLHSHCEMSVRCEDGWRGSPDPSSSSLDDQSLEPESSFSVTWLGLSVTALFAGIDDTRGNSTSLGGGVAGFGFMSCDNSW